MKVALDVGHLYKRSNAFDEGALYLGYSEGYFVRLYVERAYEMLRGVVGLEVYKSDVEKKILVGDYYERRRWVNENFSEKDLYVQCHLNAGGGDYGLILCVLGYGEGDSYVVTKDLVMLEQLYGKVLSEELERGLGIKVKDWDDNKDGIVELKKGERGYGVIEKFKCPAFIFEPCFLDNRKHFEKLLNREWIEKIAEVLCNSVVRIRGLVEVKGVEEGVGRVEVEGSRRYSILDKVKGFLRG